MKRMRQDIESELRSLLPKAPSDRMLNSIASQLAPTRRTMRWANAWTWGAAVLVVAAGITAAVLWWPEPREIPGPSPSLPVVDRPTQGHPELPPPTMLAYQQVVGQSPDGLDELLDRHAASLLVAGSPADNVGSLYQNLMRN